MNRKLEYVCSAIAMIGVLLPRHTVGGALLWVLTVLAWHILVFKGKMWGLVPAQVAFQYLATKNLLHVMGVLS